MSSSKKVLIIGPGFIGWNVLDLLVKESYTVTGYARRQAHANGLKASGASEVVLGDLNDRSKITDLVKQHDIIIHTATADHLPSVEAVLDGLRAIVNDGKGQGRIFIHTSGTSVFDDGAMGKFKSDKIYRDDRPEEVDEVSDDALHREIDLAILKAAKGDLGKTVRIALMIPPLIYGWTHDRGTIQLPTLTRFSLKHGFVPIIGPGLGVESNIHVLDLAKGYITLLHSLEKATPQTANENIYYFCECTGNHELSWYDYSKLIAESLHSAGKIKDPEPQTLKDEALWGDLFGSVTPGIVGVNSRSRAVRLQALGWRPTEKDWKRSYVEDELPNILKAT
ncbi:uncharacterized protein LTR77_009739 [Saxophila tyrrhenica]|uniref:NAD-dependent epimerase/dehydratase domain-containing protein n=1 Tax=Saxophila tyrrhenica TaxID=1690608 RepID=A0AAV9NXS1_9PEZI|nr:hypothetical protein LTR77_009739 [Saxophila tyrrhenica]